MMKKKVSAVSLDSPAKQLAGFIAKFETRVGKLIRSTRLAVRRRFPTATEIAYDNYKFSGVRFRQQRTTVGLRCVPGGKCEGCGPLFLLRRDFAGSP